MNSSSEHGRTLVVGAGLAAAKLLQHLALNEYRGEVWLIGDEPHRPYDRPPLSKEFLKGAASGQELSLLDDSTVEALDLHLRLGCAAVGLDPKSKVLSLADGSRLKFDRLVLATGSRPRRLSWWRDSPGLHELHTLDQALALRERLQRARSVAIVGGGFIGLEAASTARSLGVDVTLLEAATTLLPGKVGPGLSNFIMRMHAASGVDVRTGARVVAVSDEGPADVIRGVQVDIGELLSADLCLSAVGAEPTLDWLAGSSVADADGVVVDPQGQTAFPGIYAMGDIARWTSAQGRTVRVEHWTAATEQAMVVAHNLVRHGSMSYAPTPYFWSDQYGVRIQLLGEWCATDKERRFLGGTDTQSCFLYERDGRISAVATVGWPLAYAKLAVAFRDSRGDPAALVAAASEMSGTAA